MMGALCLALSALTNTFGFVSLGMGLVEPARAQTVPKALEEGGTDAAMKSRKNTWTVGVAGGQLSGTYMTFANELAEVLDDGDNLRVIPIVTYGAASNLDDLLYLRNVDVAVTQADVFEYFRTHRKITNLASRVNYIIRFARRRNLYRGHTQQESEFRAGRKRFESHRHDCVSTTRSRSRADAV